MCPREVQLSLTTVASADSAVAASSVRDASFFSLRCFFFAGFSSATGCSSVLVLPGASPGGVSSSISRDFFFGGGGGGSSAGGGGSALGPFFCFFGGGGGGGGGPFALSPSRGRRGRRRGS